MTLEEESGRHLVEAEQWIERKRWDLAEAAIHRGFQSTPEHEGLRYLLACVEFHTDRTEDALETLDSLLTDAPEHFPARLLRARAWRELGYLADSEQALLELLREYPADSQLLAHYAVTVLRGGQIDKAEALTKEALSIDPEDSFVLSAATLVDLARGKNLGNHQALDRLLRSEPDAEHSLRLLAVTLYREHKLDAAAEAASTLVRMSPNDRDTVRLAAEIRYQQHWSMLPLYPVMRWGWAGSIAIYVVMLALITNSRRVMPADMASFLVVAWLAYVAYSWIWPGILKRWKFRELLA